MAHRPIIVVAVPPARRGDMLTPEALARLAVLGEVRYADGDRVATAAALPGLLAGARVVVTGWGTPPLPLELLGQPTGPGLVAHAAGSVRAIVPAAALANGVLVSHAASVIADAVAEMTLLLMLACLRDIVRLDSGMHGGVPWSERPTGYAPRRLHRRAVGLVGAGYVGRRVLRLLAPFEPTVRLYDPTLTTPEATELGVTLVDLDDLFRQSEIVSVHTPAIPATRHMIGGRQLALLRDGGVFINTSRAWSVDQDALLAELAGGRISGALDVYEPEPLPADSPFRQLRNVILAPHEAGHTVETRHRQGWATVEEIERYLSGQPLQHAISAERFALMA